MLTREIFRHEVHTALNHHDSFSKKLKIVDIIRKRRLKKMTLNNSSPANVSPFKIPSKMARWSVWTRSSFLCPLNPICWFHWCTSSLDNHNDPFHWLVNSCRVGNWATLSSVNMCAYWESNMLVPQSVFASLFIAITK